MTNREALINTLIGVDLFDDGRSTEEANIHYYLSCPYFAGDERVLCKGDIEPSRKLCVKCKEIWLDSEVDE